MGDLQVWAPQPNGPLSEESPSPSPFPSLSSTSSSNPSPLSIGEEGWRKAEQITKEIIYRIQPTVVSEQRRKAVVDYVQRLIRGFPGSEVFPFGSVPLKTYLPDGDIDLTAVSSQNFEDALANDVRTVLEEEEQNKAAEFEVKDVQYIHAEVKLVKCLVQNIVVDISFNQLGGLCTLCFLEQVDRFIGKDHLFKRSIILIKAWCYYESRILGAHHGLISTYALETLVLYIFHLFHSSLQGPLAVLYRFLDYFSKFDWDNYCISLNGPVAVSSLPEIVAEAPETDGGDVLLSKDFLRGCVEMFSVPSKGQENNLRSFPQKHLNIVDPLKENNNLGRSVSKGNFYRIRSAFTYGARKLGRILLLPGESIGDELNKFFMNTLDRHGNGQRPDVQDPAPNYRGNVLFDINGSGSVKTDGPKCTEENTVSGSLSTVSSGSTGETKSDHRGVLSEEINKIRISQSERNPLTAMQPGRQSYHQPAGDEPQTCPKEASSSTMLESDYLMEGTVVSGRRMVGDAKDLATSRGSGTRITSDMHSPFLPNRELGSLSFGKVHGAPHLYFSNQFQENGRVSNGTPGQAKLKSSLPENKLCSTLQASNDDVGLGSRQDLHEMDSANSLTFQSHNNHESSATDNSADNFLVLSSEAYQAKDLYLRRHFSVINDSSEFLDSSSCGSSDVGFRERDLTASTGNPEALNGLLDLGGDCDNHLKNLRYSQDCHEYIWSGSVLPIRPPSPSQFRNKPSWDGFRQSPHWKRNMYPHMNANGVVPGSQFSPASGYYPVNSTTVSGAFVVEELPKPRGTGTYFPNVMNSRSFRDKNSPGRGRSPIPVFNTQLPRPRNNGQPTTPPESLPDKGSCEALQAQVPVFGGNIRGKPSALEFVQPGRPAARGFSHANGGFLLPSERLEFGSFGSVHLGASATEPGRKPDFNAVQYGPGSGPMPTASTMPRPALGVKQERVTKQTYHLKDEEDFPPLSV